MPTEQETTYQNSEEVHEIITAVPSWILRWGITLIFVILISVILLSALIEYPDVVKTSLKVNSLNSPKTVLAKQNGKLTALLVKNGETVKQSQPLAYFETTANPEDVLQINKQLIAFQENLLNNTNKFSELPTGLNLGSCKLHIKIFISNIYSTNLLKIMAII